MSKISKQSQKLVSENHIIYIKYSDLIYIVKFNSLEIILEREMQKLTAANKSSFTITKGNNLQHPHGNIGKTICTGIHWNI